MGNLLITELEELKKFCVEGNNIRSLFLILFVLEGVKPFDDTIRETIYRVCAYNNWVPMALQVMPDHVHFFVSAPPKWAPARVVQSLKSWTSKDLREKFAIIRQTRYSDDLWASSYYCGTAGHVSAEVVAKYIRENSSKY